jgi:hypothetical protein
MGKMRDALCWMPETEEDRRRVQEELTAILASKHFQKSKRYRALLRFLVEKAMDGQSGLLKERTLGVEVFDRRPDYDTNADPVVRFSAAEIRKRIAQYYHEAEEGGGAGSELHIELPLGSYAPEFRMKVAPRTPSSQTELRRRRTDSDGVSQLQPKSLTIARESVAIANAHPVVASRSLYFAKVAAVLAVLVSAGLLGYRALHPNTMDAMWSPVLRTSDPVLIVLGYGNLAPDPPQTTFYDHMIGPNNHISLSSSIALSRITSRLEKRDKNWAVKVDSAATLADLRERSVIAIGALNNKWALRLTDQLRFRFVPGPLARIEDVKNPQNNDWAVDFSQPFSAVTHDYAIVARYHDTLTNGTTMIIGGLGPYGTEAASEFVSSTRYLDQISHQVPGNWAEKNLEMVIRTDVVAGEAGPPNLVAISTW